MAAITTQGSAARGSRKCLQDWVQHRGEQLADLIVTASPGLTAFGPTAFAWKSPLPEEDYREYRDDFWRPLGLTESEAAQVRGFWPAQGPQWDGLAVLRSHDGRAGYLLVEAKAHPAETKSTMGATNPTSVEQITVALAETKGFMGAPAGAGWLTGAYQLCNRLAFLYFMQERLRLPTWLALVNFVGDTSLKPTGLADWREHYQGLFDRLGLAPQARLLDRCILVFPPAQPVAG